MATWKDLNEEYMKSEKLLQKYLKKQNKTWSDLPSLLEQQNEKLNL